MESIVKTLEQTITQVHITNGINSLWEVHTSWHLTISVSPLVLNSLHVPLVDDDHNFLLGALVNCLEKILISLVNEDLFESWEVNVHVLNIPVQYVRICTLL